MQNAPKGAFVLVFTFAKRVYQSRLQNVSADHDCAMLKVPINHVCDTFQGTFVTAVTLLYEKLANIRGCVFSIPIFFQVMFCIELWGFGYWGLGTVGQGLRANIRG